MASVKDIKAQISNLATLKQPPQQVREQTTKEEVIEYPVRKENTQTDKGLGAFLTTLVEGKDFGYLPNVQKPVLFKQGALRILQFLKCTYTVTLVDKTIIPTEKLISYTVCVSVLTSEGQQIGQALGSTNSLETKFIKSGFSADNMLVSMATKRALLEAVRTLLIRI